MINESAYESLEEMEGCREKARLEIKKLVEQLGFVVFDVAEEIRVSRKSARERREYYTRRTRGGSSY